MNTFLIIIYVICGAYMLFNFKHDIHMLQQNSYRITRYWRYLKNDIGSSWRLMDVAMLFLVSSTLLDIRLSSILVALVALIKIYILAKKKFKKPLVFTKRVWRIYSVTSVLALLAYVIPIILTWGDNEVFGLYKSPVICLDILLLITILSWVFVIIAVCILNPVEIMINRKFYNEAVTILESMPDLKVIGITGSYGKTSTKHYLYTILSEEFEVIMTPGSFNTPMGVIRTVREMMKPYDSIFICEMGAKQKGDVKEICDLVHPSIGIITAVGPMHLETFKSIENVQSTKFELIDSLPSDGLAVVNNDFEYCNNRPVKNVKCERYTVEDKPESQYRGKNIEYSPEGTRFVIVTPEGKEIAFTTKLVGACNISNLMGAIIVALYLGMSEKNIQKGVREIQQVEHRLNVKQTPGGVTIIDDAFNSNPIGSKMAMEVLGNFNGGKRIVVTPGMIELGDKQVELNEVLGHHIAMNVDVAIVVGHYNREAIISGIKKKNILKEENIYEVESFNEAQVVLSRILKPGDTVLYENDLPDSFK